MDFFDCNAFIGHPAQGLLAPVATAAELLAHMDRAGVKRALVWHIAQHEVSPQTGNAILTKSIAPHSRLVGCWTVLPNQTREFPEPAVLLQQMRSAGVRALRVFPDSHKFLLNAVSMGGLLATMSRCRVPLILSVKRGCTWRGVYDVLAAFPNLTCLVCDHGCWGEDRLFRPLLERYPNVVVDTSQYLLDGGIEAFVADYGARRLLYGSGFPESHFGGMMMAIKHARIPLEAKRLIAGDNLARLLGEATATDPAASPARASGSDDRPDGAVSPAP